MPPARKTKTQKAIKKPVVESPINNDDDDEITEDPKDIKISKLLEEIRKLKLENASLRKNIEEPNLTKNILTPKARHLTVTNTPKVRRQSLNSSKIKEKGCSCTGSCANKKCGCVKREISCTEFCKCSNGCQNQMSDDDDTKENQDNNVGKNRIVNEKNVSKKRGGQNRMDSSSESEIKSSPPSNIERNSSDSSNASSQPDEEETDLLKKNINPMKPTRQLPRSPLHQQNISPNATTNTTVFNEDDVFLPMPKVESEDEMSPPPEILQMEVDWEKHQATLVECRKCKRRFDPHRVRKHEQSCKKI